MYIETLQDLSMYYFIKDLLAATTYIRVVDQYPEVALTAPTVSVEQGVLTYDYFELGSTETMGSYSWFIDVFAVNKTQRDEISIAILNSLKSGIPVYDYNEGFPPDVTPSLIGKLQPLSLSFKPIKNFADPSELVRWRGEVSFIANYEEK